MAGQGAIAFVSEAVRNLVRGGVAGNLRLVDMVCSEYAYFAPQ
jgi:hypothetical protein